MNFNPNFLAPIIASTISIGTIIFHIGKQSEHLSILDNKVLAQEEKHKFNDKILYDVHGKLCKAEEQLKTIENDIKYVKNKIIK